MIDDATIITESQSFMDFTSNEKFDLVIAVELLMHVTPDIIDFFVFKMKSHAKNIITIDYDPTQPRDIVLASHNFLHDYNKLLPNADITQVNYLQKMRVWKNVL